MEDLSRKLDKIIENTKPKSSYMITFNGKGGKIEKSFEPEISVASGCHYEIAFTSLETYFSIPNIDASNNLLQITNSKVWSEVKIETGCYGLVSLNTSISRKLDVLDMTKAVQFEANYSTFKCIMNIKKGFSVDFSKKESLSTVLGFDKKVYKAGTSDKSFESERIVNIMKVNSILVHCDLVDGSYFNGRKAPIIYSFFPLAEPGDKIVEKPTEYIYLPISSDVIRRMSVWLTDQDLNPINLRDESLTIEFHLRSC